MFLFEVRRSIFFSTSLFTVTLAFAAPSDPIPNNVSGRDAFEQSIEFPNYFLPEGFSALPTNNQSSILTERRLLLESATASILRRLRVPVAQKGTNALGNVFYFDYVSSEVSKIDVTAEVLPSSGVLRAVIGVIYEQVDHQMRLSPNADPLEALRKIASATEPVDAIDVRGVGSDFDILVRSRKDRFEVIQKRIDEVTNSAEVSLSARADDSSAKRMLFTVGDIKFYDDQINRSTTQGGATIDWLAFDLKTGRFIEPANASYIISDLLQGKYRYLPSAPGATPEDSQKQTIRGLRALIEMPFLNIQDESQYRRELHDLISDVEAGKPIAEKALEQIGKAIRNGRRSLGNNRILRGRDGSLEQLIFRLSSALRSRQQPYIPEYVPSDLLELRDPSAKQELRGFPKELLTSYQEFAKSFSDSGTVYHGTPTLDNAMAILRGGLFVSGGVYDQGGSAEGSGGYAGKTRAEAKMFVQGLVLPLPIKSDPRVNIVVWENVKSHPFILEAQARAGHLGMNINAFLFRFHGIDLVIGNACMIQNMEAVELGTAKSRVKLIVGATISAAENKEQSAYTRMEALAQHLRLVDYGRALGLETVRDYPALDRILTDLLREEDLELIKQAGTIFSQERDASGALPESWKAFRAGLSKRIVSPDRYHAAQVFFDNPKLAEQLPGELMELIKSKPGNILDSRELLSALFAKNPILVERLPSHFSALLDGDDRVLPSVGSVFARNPEIAKKMPNVWARFVEKVNNLHQQKDLARLGAIFGDGPELSKALPEIWAAYARESLEVFTGIKETTLTVSNNPEVRAAIMFIRSSSLYELLPGHLMALIKSDNSQMQTWIAEKFLETPILAEKLPDHFKALTATKNKYVLSAVAATFRAMPKLAVTLPGHFSEFVKARNIETLPAQVFVFTSLPFLAVETSSAWVDFQEQITNLVNSKEIRARKMAFSLFSENPTLALLLPKTFVGLIRTLPSDEGMDWRSLDKRFGDVNFMQQFWDGIKSDPKALAVLFSHPKLQSVFHRLLEQEVSKAIPDEIIQLAKDKGPRAARQALKDRLAVEGGLGPTRCRNALIQIYLRRLPAP